MRKLFITLCLSLGFVSAAVADTYISYSTDNFDRKGGVRFGNSETQGLAIKLPKEKLDMLRGKQIKGVRAAFGTRNMSDLKFFVSTDLSATPAYTQTASGGDASWNDFMFDTPYTIGDEQELYVGYTLTANKSYLPLLLDLSNGLADRAFCYDGSGWRDAYGTLQGNPTVQLIVDDMSFTDLTVKGFSTSGYYVADKAYTYSGEVYNFGTQPINSFDVTFRIGNSEPQVLSFTGLNISSHGNYSFSLSDYASSEYGDMPIELSVSNINGAADADASDNTALNSVYIYPAGMRHSLLLESFTGQSCPNCPTGHQNINTALSRFDGDVVEVFHHIGYYPDNFTMKEEMFYLNFYGTAGTFAPAFMVNRMASETSGVPVQNSLNAGTILQMLTYASTIQPYFGIDINSNYDEATRTAKGSVDIFTHVMPDADTLMVSLLLVQDSIVATQSAGSDNYVHRYVYRGSLFGNFGIRANLEKGTTVGFPFEYELPESIVSTYYEGEMDPLPSIDTDPSNMYLVAVVSKYKVNSDGTLDCPVYNVAKVKLCADNVAMGIDDVENTAAPAIDLSGNVLTVKGSCNRVEVYDMSGRMVRSASGAVSLSLPSGLYVVRASGASGSVARKVVVTR